MRYSIYETINNVQKRLQVELAYNTTVHIRYPKREAKKESDRSRPDRSNININL
jgi:hypothetical protein